MRWGLGQLEDTPSLGFSERFLEHPRAPHGRCLALARLCVWGEGRLIIAQELRPEAGATPARDLGYPRKGQCEQGLRGPQFRGKPRVAGWGSVDCGREGAAGIGALTRVETLWSLCRLSTHHQASFGDSDPGLLLWVRQMLFYKPSFGRIPPHPRLPVLLDPIDSQPHFLFL